MTLSLHSKAGTSTRIFSDWPSSPPRSFSPGLLLFTSSCWAQFDFWQEGFKEQWSGIQLPGLFVTIWVQAGYLAVLEVGWDRTVPGGPAQDCRPPKLGCVLVYSNLPWPAEMGPCPWLLAYRAGCLASQQVTCQCPGDCLTAGLPTSLGVARC